MSAQFQITQNLRRVDRQQFLYSFHFDNDFPLNKNVQAVTGVKTHPGIDYRKLNLPFDSHSLIDQLMSQANLICAFEQART